jgi:Putative restriction endonuclease
MNSLAAVSSPTDLPPLEDVCPERRWTIAEFERLLSAGFLREGGPEFLWNGKILTPMSENPPHVLALDALFERLLLALGSADWSIRQDHPLDLREHYQPQPNVAVARGPRRNYRDRQPRPEDVALVVEVSDSSYPIDSGVMLREYAGAGIAIYWIVNLAACRVEVYLNPRGAGDHATYDPPRLYGLDDAVPLRLSPGAGLAERVYPPIAVREILGDTLRT